MGVNLIFHSVKIRAVFCVAFIISLQHYLLTNTFSTELYNRLPFQNVIFTLCAKFDPWNFYLTLNIIRSHISIDMVKASFDFLLYYCPGYCSSLQNCSMWSNFSHATMIKHCTAYEHWIS